MNQKVNIIIMSGIDDGTLLSFDTQNQEGTIQDGEWILSIGRRDENDIVLRNDTFVSREHAQIICQAGEWTLKDCASTNGTFCENLSEFFEDIRVEETMPLKPNDLFRVGRTWLRLQIVE